MSNLRDRLKETIFGVASEAGMRGVLRQTDASSVYEPDVDKVIDDILQALPEEYVVSDGYDKSEQDMREGWNALLSDITKMLNEARNVK